MICLSVGQSAYIDVFRLILSLVRFFSRPRSSYVHFLTRHEGDWICVVSPSSGMVVRCVRWARDGIEAVSPPATKDGNLMGAAMLEGVRYLETAAAVAAAVVRIPFSGIGIEVGLLGSPRRPEGLRLLRRV